MSNTISIQDIETGEHIVKKSNDLVRAYYNMSINELRIINTAISFIKDEECRIVDIPVPSYKQLLDVKSINYEYTRSILAKLRENTIVMTKIDKNTGEAYDVLITGWVNRIQLKDSYLSIEFNEDVWGHLVKQKNKFTKYQLANGLKLTTNNAYRLYEILKSYEWIGTYQVKVAELRNLLFLENKYKKYSDLNRNIIEPSIKEINSLEDKDIEVSYVGVKVGRNIDYIIFTIKKIQKNSDNENSIYPQEVIMARNMSEIELFISIKTLIISQYKIMFTSEDKDWVDFTIYTKFALETTYVGLLTGEWKDHPINNAKAFFAEHLRRESEKGA